MRSSWIVGLFVAMLFAHGAIEAGSSRARDREAASLTQLAQFGAMTKQKPTPVPRQTPASDRGQRREGAAQRPQSSFGTMQK